MADGQTSRWIGVGSVNFNSLSALINSFGKYKSLHADISVNILAKFAAAFDSKPSLIRRWQKRDLFSLVPIFRIRNIFPIFVIDQPGESLDHDDP